MTGPVAFDMGRDSLPAGVEMGIILRADSNIGRVKVVKSLRQWRKLCFGLYSSRTTFSIRGGWSLLARQSRWMLLDWRVAHGIVRLGVGICNERHHDAQAPEYPCGFIRISSLRDYFRAHSISTINP